MAWKDIAARVDRTAARPFQTDATYTHDPTGTPVVIPLRGVFDEPTFDVETAAGQIIDARPNLGIAAADLAAAAAAPATGDEVTVEGRDWVLEDWDYDPPAVGLTLWLHLKE